MQLKRAPSPKSKSTQAVSSSAKPLKFQHTLMAYIMLAIRGIVEYGGVCSHELKVEFDLDLPAVVFRTVYNCTGVQVQ